MNWRCFFGHKLITVGLSKYRQTRGIFGILEKKQIVVKCQRCSYSELPEWYSEDYRLLHPFVEVDGHSAEWKPEFPELLTPKG